MHAICLSAVDRRVIICADDVAHRTGKKTGLGSSVCEVDRREEQKVLQVFDLLCP